MCSSVCLFILGSVGIETRYGLDGPGYNPGRGEIFLTRPEGPGANLSSYTVGNWSFRGVNWQGREFDHQTLSNAEVKERVML